MRFKGSPPFRAITRVPFIWSDPADRSGRTSGLLASTVDLAPTNLERAGPRPFFGMRGKSFPPHLDGTEGLRDELLIEYNDSMPRLGFRAPPRVRSLVSGKWRYTVYLGQEWGELYDLANDPDETTNLWESAEHAERLNHHLIPASL